MKTGVPVDLITIVEFVVFSSDTQMATSADQKTTEMPFYNSTPEQCIKYIQKNIWETAQIKKITEYNIQSDGIRRINVVDILKKVDDVDHSKFRGGAK